MAYKSPEKRKTYQIKYRLTSAGKEARKREIVKDRGNRRKRWAEYRKFFYDLRIEWGGKCSSCGYCKDIRILQFHHLRDKKFTICAYRGPMSAGVERRIRTEANKCILLCPNCHWEVTMEEIQQKYKHEPVC